MQPVENNACFAGTNHALELAMRVLNGRNSSDKRRQEGGYHGKRMERT